MIDEVSVMWIGRIKEKEETFLRIGRRSAGICRGGRRYLVE